MRQVFFTFNRSLGTGSPPPRSVSSGGQRLRKATGQVAQGLHGLPTVLSSGTLGRGSRGWPSLRLAPQHLEGKQVNSVGLSLDRFSSRAADQPDTKTAAGFSSNGVFVFASRTISEGRTSP